MAEVEVNFRGTPVYARRRAEAFVEFDILMDFHGYGETHEQARQDLLKEVEKHAEKVQLVLEKIRGTTAPDIPVIR